MKKRIMAVVLAATVILLLGACSGSGQIQGTGSSQAEDAGDSQTEDAGNSQAGNIGNSQAGDTDSRQSRRENMTLDRMKEEVKGITVTFYSWDGDEKLNRWLDGEFARVMKEKYDITMECVPIDIDQVLNQLTGEIQAGEKDGDTDMTWTNGKNFQSTKENNMLYGLFINKLPNLGDYMDGESEDVTTDFTYPTEGYEAPYDRAQLVVMADLAVAPDVPKNAGELKEFVEKCPSKVTYPTLPDFTGSAFVRSIIYEICGYEQFMDMATDKETVRTAMAPAMEYLRELNPYPRNQDAAFPNSSTTANNMSADGELATSMTYGTYDVALNIEGGKYTNTTAASQLEGGAIGNTSFMAIAVNSSSKAGTMAAINEMISPEIQADRYEKLRIIPVLDNEKLSSEQKATFGRMSLGKGTIPQDEFLSKRLPGMPAQLVLIIEGIWTEEVIGK